MKRVFSLILCLALVLSLAVSGSATTITFKDGAKDSVYTAYKLLDAGVGADDSSFSYSVNNEFRAFWLRHATTRPAGETDGQFGQYIVGILSGYQNDSEEMNELAKAAYAYVLECNGDDVTENNIVGIPSKTNEGADPTLVAGPGYYLIVETTLGSDVNDTRSLYMLNNVGNKDINIHTKESAPKVTKEVKGKNDSITDDEHYRTYADYDLGDEMEFKITGTLSGRYAQYTNYDYAFVDTMHGGLVAEIETVNGKERPKGVKIMVGNTDITNQFTFELTKDTKNESYIKSFKAKANLKTISAVTTGSTIVLTYKGKLVADSQDALVFGATGNANEVHLEYQRDPYADGTGSTDGVTPPDTAVVFTYKGVINKVGLDAGGNQVPLTKATFKLEKFIAGDTNDWVEVKTIGPDNTTTFVFEGLDVGRYRVTETAPDGYYPIRPFVFEIKAEYDITKDPATLTDLKITDVDGVDLGAVLNLDINITEADGKFETTILNTKGGALPTTGGMGTTLIYAAGGILVLAAIVLLVTKKRMSNAE